MYAVYIGQTRRRADALEEFQSQPGPGGGARLAGRRAPHSGQSLVMPMAGDPAPSRPAGPGRIYGNLGGRRLRAGVAGRNMANEGGCSGWAYRSGQLAARSFAPGVQLRPWLPLIR